MWWWCVVSCRVGVHICTIEYCVLARHALYKYKSIFSRRKNIRNNLTERARIPYRSLHKTRPPDFATLSTHGTHTHTHSGLTCICVSVCLVLCRVRITLAHENVACTHTHTHTRLSTQFDYTQSRNCVVKLNRMHL